MIVDNEIIENRIRVKTYNEMEGKENEKRERKGEQKEILDRTKRGKRIGIMGER